MNLTTILLELFTYNLSNCSGRHKRATKNSVSSNEGEKGRNWLVLLVPESHNFSGDAWFCVCVCVLSRAQLNMTPLSVACQDPPSLGFSWQEYCGELPFGDLPTQALNPCLLHWQADSLLLSHQGSKKHA